MHDVCYINGRIVPRAEARIDPLDRGFVFGDALYEVIKVRGGTALFLGLHLERLACGLARVDIPMPGGLAAACRDLVVASGLETGSLYLQITRGVAPRQHVPPSGLAPTVVMLPAEHAFDPPASRAMRVITVPDWRWRRCSIKTTSLMGTVLGKLAVRDAGADEVIFAGADGELLEGGSTNLFVRRDGALETHPLDERVLAGVTRRLVFEVARREGLPVRERSPRAAEREEWQEAFLTGTLTGLQGVAEVDGEPVAGGGYGEWTRRVAGLLAAEEEREVAR